MTRRYIAELTPGEQIEDQVFLVASKDLRTTSQGSLYIHAVLADRTGQLLARVWQASESMYNALPEGGFVRLKGRTESYKGSLQFIIDAIRLVDDPGSLDLGEFLPRTEGDVEAMWARARKILSGIKNEYLAALVGQLLADEELMRRFRTAPAASQMHHAYIGGLLEHTLAVLELALVVIPKYPKLSMDLVLAGVFLHDLAKTAELKYETNFAYTDSGQLVGHVTLGAVWIELKAAAAAKKLGKPFPSEIKWALQHIVLAHHGKYEFGSPRLPATPEAIAIHHLDNLDAKVSMMLRAIETDDNADSNWTDYQRALETRVYKPDVLGDRPG
jgi:3'-5' exoribonuclease